LLKEDFAYDDYSECVLLCIVLLVLRWHITIRCCEILHSNTCNFTPISWACHCTRGIPTLANPPY
jgi:hypothetical protein